MWIQREISDSLGRNNAFVQILLGPRRVGKTSLLEHLSEGYQRVSLDDLRARALAEENPEIFLSQFGDRPHRRLAHADSQCKRRAGSDQEWNWKNFNEPDNLVAPIE